MNMLKSLGRITIVLALIAMQSPRAFAQCSWNNITETCGTVEISSPSSAVGVHITSALGSSTYGAVDRPSASADGGLLFRTAGAVTSEWFLGKLGGQNSESLYIAYSNLLTPMFAIDINGHVGIGTSTPGARLDVG